MQCDIKRFSTELSNLPPHLGNPSLRTSGLYSLELGDLNKGNKPGVPRFKYLPKEFPWLIDKLP